MSVAKVTEMEQHVSCAEGRVTEYQVNMMVTLVLDD